jgi:MFS family permease
LALCQRWNPPVKGVSHQPAAAADPHAVDNTELRALLGGTLVVTLDFFAINVALAPIRDQLGATAAQLQWIVAAYGFAYSAGLLVGSRFGDRFGHQRSFAVGTALFAAASICASLAPSATLLIAARLAQGIGAAALSPQVLSLIAMQADSQRRERAFADYGVALGLGSGLGQLMGAILIEWAAPLGGWRTIFVVNGAVALIAGILIGRRRSPRGSCSTPLDTRSVGLLLLSSFCMLIPMIEGRRLHWPVWMLLLWVVAALGLVTFAKRQRALAATGLQPLVPLGAFTAGSTHALLTVPCFYAGVASFFLVLSLTLRAAYGLPPVMAALTFCIMVVGFLVTTFNSRPLARRWGHRPLLVGAGLNAIAHALLAMLMGRGAVLGALWPVLLLAGSGLGMLMGSLITRSVGVVSSASSGLAAGLVGSAQWLGNSLGVAVIGTIYFSFAQDDTDPADIQRAAAACHWVLAMLAVIVAVLLAQWPTAAARKTEQH